MKSSIKENLNKLSPESADFNSGNGLLDVKETNDVSVLNKELAHQKVLLNYFAGTFTSAYFINLAKDTFEVLHMDHDFPDLFGNGNTNREAMLKFIDEHIHPADRELMLQSIDKDYIRNRLKNEPSFSFTLKEVFGDVERIMRCLIVRSADKDHIAVGFMDITDQEHEMRDRQKKFEKDYEIAVALSKKYESIYYVNTIDDTYDHFHSSDDFGTLEIPELGKNFFEESAHNLLSVSTEEDRKPILDFIKKENLLKALESGSVTLDQYTLTVEDRKYYYSMHAIQPAANDPHIIVAVENITQKVLARQAREAVAARDAAVISGLSDDFGCVVYVDFKTAKEVIYRLDPMLEKNIPGWSRIDNFDTRLRSMMNTIVHVDDRKYFWAATRPIAIKDELSRGNAYFINFRVILDGELVYYQAKFVRDEHSDDHIIAGFHSVDGATKREMAALEKAEAANRAKTSFLFNMSHDIRTPMNAIIGFTNIAMKEINNPEKVTECLKKVQLSSDMLLALINDILDMSRIESGKVAMSADKINLQKVFDNIEPVMSSLAAGKDIDLNFTIHDLANKFVFADTARLERVLVNIISNGIKYTLGGGHVDVSIEQIAAEENRSAKYRFTISDNGIGMSEEFQRKMYDEFAREESTTISGVQGTGLGLSLAKKLVDMMNGSIDCKSQQGVGSTFTIDIPFRLQDEDELEEQIVLEKKTVTVSLEGKRVLLVEDNELNRDIATDILENAGMVVETAEDGKIAFDLVSEKGPDYYDFVLMDIQMPVMDGYESTKAIRKTFNDSNLPIIALSANAFEEDRKKSLAAGMNEHVAKPIKVDVLLNTLTNILSESENK